jgi:hypothetical protein
MKCKMFGYEESVVAESERVFKLFEDTDEDGGGSLDGPRRLGAVKRP